MALLFIKFLLYFLYKFIKHIKPVAKKFTAGFMYTIFLYFSIIFSSYSNSIIYILSYLIFYYCCNSVFTTSISVVVAVCAGL